MPFDSDSFRDRESLKFAENKQRIKGVIIRIKLHKRLMKMNAVSRVYNHNKFFTGN